jgi:hypothetical protein
MKREYYSDSIQGFLKSNPNDILGLLLANSDFDVTQPQRGAWLEEISILKRILTNCQGSIYFEYNIPRMGQRIDVILLIGPVIFVLEFKIGEKDYRTQAVDQAWDYALDLKNFHDTSHGKYISPILIASKGKSVAFTVSQGYRKDKLLLPISCNADSLGHVIQQVLSYSDGENIDRSEWEGGRYCPTPTIIEAAMALYRGHSVAEISRSDAGAINLKETSESIAEIIHNSKKNKCKSICFVTGVPGAGKTLVGLNIATIHIDKSNDLYSVFLSGNGPLVKILQEALARDKVSNAKSLGKKIRKKEALSEVKLFVQNVHHFRDDCLVDIGKTPIEHVALFDEAQRAWNKEQTTNFMHRKKRIPDFNKSEPEFLISCMDRHSDWAVIVCLVGGGQEINTGEAGINEWIESLNRSFPSWDIYISSRLHDSEFGAGNILKSIGDQQKVNIIDDLHLAVSMRSFRAENVSLLVKQLLDLDSKNAQQTLSSLNSKYPIVLTRDIAKAKQWLKMQARGSERYGIVVSSQAERLKPYAMDVKSPLDPIHWFLDGKEDVRSSFYLEDVATEFAVQGLELDWVCVTWDADFRFTNTGWQHWSFVGYKWNHIKKIERQNYLKNAYRVLLTRARQGMVIAVPPGDDLDKTRQHDFYDPTFEYLREIGFPII